MAFYTPPYSFQKSVLIAAVFGAVSPFLMKLLHMAAGVAPGGWVFLVVFLAAVAALHFVTRRGALAGGLEGFVTTIGPVALVLLGTAGSVWCCLRHVCPDGHMACPPYPEWHTYLEGLWVLMLAGSALWASLARSPACLFLTAYAAFLLSFRFLFDSFGGVYPLPL